MLIIPELKDIEKLFFKVEELNERTKKQTKKIQELKREVKRLKVKTKDI
jgi:peptidoglycan hydrolase CwlO-like protein